MENIKPQMEPETMQRASRQASMIVFYRGLWSGIIGLSHFTQAAYVLLLSLLCGRQSLREYCLPQYGEFRTSMRVMTAVWGVGFLLEAAIRIYLVTVLSTEQFLIVSPFVIYGIIGLLMAWTFYYGRQRRKRSEELRQRMVVEQNDSISHGNSREV